MESELSSISCAFLRGGTSRALFLYDEDIHSFFSNHLIKNTKENVFKLIGYLMGNQDETRVDGLSGSLSHTSKAAIIKKSENKGSDIDFSFFQLSTHNQIISNQGTCGNILSAVSLYVFKKNIFKLNPVVKNPPEIIIKDINTGNLIRQTIEINEYCFIDGIMNPSVKVISDYGLAFPKKSSDIFPTKNKKNIIYLSSFGQIEVTICNMVNLCVFISSSFFSEMNIPIDDNDDFFKAVIKEIRGKSAVLSGILKNWEEVDDKCPSIPLVVILYAKDKERFIQVDTVSLNRLHHSIPVSAAICIAVASQLNETLVNDFYLIEDIHPENIKIIHRSGEVNVLIDIEDRENCIFNKIQIDRNARYLMSGKAEIDMRVFKQMLV